MGGILSLFSRLFGSKERRILILGLDGAGKTTILYRLQVGEVVTTIPTIGFNVETVVHKNLKFQVWDLGGQTSIRPYWRCYYSNTDAIIYVVDSMDRDRVGISKQELFSMLEVYLTGPSSTWDPGNRICQSAPCHQNFMKNSYNPRSRLHYSPYLQERLKNRTIAK
ncbi:unnamed protein product [Heterobilharzia americana]|nr:unnamed protein product [Heterobilharzia americana]